MCQNSIDYTKYQLLFSRVRNEHSCHIYVNIYISTNNRVFFSTIVRAVYSKMTAN